MKRLVEVVVAVTLLGLPALALGPVLDRAAAHREVRRQLDAIEARGVRGLALTGTDPGMPSLAMVPPLASWGSIGGCGAGGGSASSPGGGIKWIGRNVTGGLIDAQALTTQTYANGNQFTTVGTRLGVNPTTRLGLALNVPVLYKAGDVTVLGQTQGARISGFGDVSVEASYKLGAIGAHQLMAVASVPTGSADAVRQGIVLPQHLQLGSGVPGLTAQYQYTRDRDWGLLLFGGSASYAGWENDLGDYRAPSATAYAHAGYMAGPWVPSAGLTLFGKPHHDREGGADRSGDRDPLFLVSPSIGLEWSNDWIAFLPAATLGLSYNGFESVSFGIGVSSSLF